MVSSRPFFSISLCAFGKNISYCILYGNRADVGEMVFSKDQQQRNVLQRAPAAALRKAKDLPQELCKGA